MTCEAIDGSWLLELVIGFWADDLSECYGISCGLWIYQFFLSVKLDFSGDGCWVSLRRVECISLVVFLD